MAHWARGARWIVAVAGTAFVAVVFLSLRERERPVAPAPIVTADVDAEMEMLGATSTQWSGTDERFTVRSSRQLAYADGRVRHDDLTVHVDDLEGNRQFVATAHQGDVNAGSDHLVMKGEVRLVASDGLEMEADEATYDTGDRIVRAEGPVTFSQGRLSGRGIGMTFDRRLGLLRLLQQAHVFVAPDEIQRGSLEATAETAILARREHYVRFEHDVVMLRDEREIRADIAVGYLTEDESALTGLDLRGRSRIETANAAAGTMRTMRARDINLEYAEDGERMERATLVGEGLIEIAGELRDDARRIRADMLDVELGEDGSTVTKLTGEERVVLEFPAAGETPARVISAAFLDGAGGPDGGLTSAVLRRGVEYREPRSAASAARVVRSDRLELALTPGLAGITGARFIDAVGFEQGDLRATAEMADYATDSGRIDLSRAEGDPQPKVVDARMSIEADTIALTADGPKVLAKGAVRSLLTASGDGAEGGDAARMPGFLADDQPVNVTADSLDYDGAAALAQYTGSSRLWQGRSAVSGTAITIDTGAGNLTATGSVRTVLLVASTATPQAGAADGTAGTAATAGADAPVDPAGGTRTGSEPVIGAAGSFDYDDAAGRLTYTTTAHVNGPQGDLVADRIEMFMIEGTNELERVEAAEAVTLREDTRTATGAAMTYFSEGGRYDMSGAPVRIVEGCRESTGRSLTFYKTRDEVLIDGQRLLRTRTRNEGTCAEPAPVPGNRPRAGTRR